VSVYRYMLLSFDSEIVCVCVCVQVCCYDWDVDGSHDLIGEFTTTLAELTQASQNQKKVETYN